MKISSWQRHGPNAMPPAAKGTGMYINSSMAKVEALKAGYDEAILLSPQGYVSECTGENIFVVSDGAIITPPVVGRRARGHHPGLGARRSRATSAIEVHVANILRSDLYTADEAFLIGHRGRGRADPLGRRPRDRRARPDHAQDPGDLRRRRARQGRPLQGLDRTCQRLT